jgi:hypothetical protein
MEFAALARASFAQEPASSPKLELPVFAPFKALNLEVDFDAGTD